MMRYKEPAIALRANHQPRWDYDLPVASCHILAVLVRDLLNQQYALAKDIKTCCVLYEVNDVIRMGTVHITLMPPSEIDTIVLSTVRH
jgi:hypothetical protein